MAKTQINPKRFGEQMSRLREAARMTLEGLADESGLDVERLRSIEAGTVEVTKKDCKRLGKVLQIPKPVVEFLGVDPDDEGSLAELVQMTQDAVLALVVAQSKSKSKLTHSSNGNGKSKKKNTRKSQ